VIQFSSVSKTYRSITGRAVPAVVDFTLDVREGEVLGLAGPNGAGKSTLIALLLGYLAPTSGTVTIAGHRPRDFIERYGIGYMSELVAIPNAWRTENALKRYALLAGVETRRVQERVDAVIALLGLEEHRRKLIKQLPKGNLQRVGLAQALLCDERVLILDEPTHGLDPMWTQRFRELVGDLRRSDRAILIASHNLDELQRVSDRVAIIDRGRLQRVVDLSASGSVGGETPYRLVISRGADIVAEVFRDATRVNELEFDLTPRALEELNRELGDFIARGGLVASIAPAHSALEQQFREVVSQ
jgi:ABC-type multidrug transport system ATPase subunit